MNKLHLLRCLITGKDPNDELAKRVAEKTAMIARIRAEHEKEVRRIHDRH